MRSKNFKVDYLKSNNPVEYRKGTYTDNGNTITFDLSTGSHFNVNVTNTSIEVLQFDVDVPYWFDSQKTYYFTVKVSDGLANTSISVDFLERDGLDFASYDDVVGATLQAAAPPKFFPIGNLDIIGETLFHFSGMYDVTTEEYKWYVQKVKDDG